VVTLQYTAMRVEHLRKVLRRNESLSPEDVSAVCMDASIPVLSAKEFLVEMWPKGYHCPEDNTTITDLVVDCALLGSPMCHKLLSEGGDPEFHRYHSQCATSTPAEAKLSIILSGITLFLLLLIVDSPLWSLLSLMWRNKEACLVLFGIYVWASLQMESRADPVPDPTDGAAPSPASARTDLFDPFRVDNCGASALITQWLDIVWDSFVSVLMRFVAFHIVATILSPLVSLLQQSLRKVFGNKIIICTSVVLFCVVTYIIHEAVFPAMDRLENASSMPGQAY